MAEEGGGEEELAVVGAGDMEGQIVVAGAAYEEDGGRGGGGGGAGGDEGIFRGDDQFIPPPGFRFKPSDEELIRYYLLPKLQGREYVPNRAIIEHNVYQCHPDQLTGQYMDRGEGKSFYFLSPRVRRYDNGDRPRRDTDDGRGRWKVSTGKTEKEEKKLAGDGTTYCFSVLNYFESPRGGGRKSEWLMRELTVPGYEIKLPKDGGPGGKTLDRYVMCKIYIKDDKGDDDEEAGPSSASPLRLHGPVEGDKWATAEIPKLSKKQAGKRPRQPETDEMLEQRVLQQNPAAATGDAVHAAAAAAGDGVHDAPAAAMEDVVHDAPAPYLDGSNADYHHHAGSVAPNLSLDEAAQRYERRRVVLPATSGGSPGVAATVKAEGSPVSTVDSVEGNEEGCNNNGGCGN
ncbi:NAC domain-containing protein 71-like [Hordeum vulgare subsp. vulgare]|uniref:NAC domain-containing protein 71-like n=1 Tax=Hordeum vulgare subsp. vulgare TaxID=112509 RepID=UPI001D1A4136|nr:NAC domain-containing protein 71-like [Hordeum vulgare subsp. vulgare]